MASEQIDPPASFDETILKQELLLSTLPHIAFDGWTQKAVDAGASDLGLTKADGRRTFPDGPRDVLAYFHIWANQQVLAALTHHDLAALKVRERIALALRLRLELVTPYREAVRRGLYYLLSPQHAVLMSRLVYQTVDAIWHGIGDRSTDFNFYTKRALLAGIYSATLLYWLNDSSENFHKTYSFLDRRLDDIMIIPRVKSRIGRAASHLPDPLRFARQFRQPR